MAEKVPQFQIELVLWGKKVRKGSEVTLFFPFPGTFDQGEALRTPILDIRMTRGSAELLVQPAGYPAGHPKGKPRWVWANSATSVEVHRY